MEKSVMKQGMMELREGMYFFLNFLHHECAIDLNKKKDASNCDKKIVA